MFEKILVLFTTDEHTEHTAEVAFEVAQKFESKITFLKCLTKEPPKFGFFESKGQVKDREQRLIEGKDSLKIQEDAAKKLNIEIETQVDATDSLQDFLVEYVNSNPVDLLIIDSHSLDEVQKDDHKEMINRIYTNVSCPILTLH